MLYTEAEAGYIEIDQRAHPLFVFIFFFVFFIFVSYGYERLLC